MKMNQIKIAVFLFLSLLSFKNCERDSKDMEIAVPNENITPVSNGNRVIYEVNVRNYSDKGFKGVTGDLDRLKSLGVDILWLMPIHPIGEENRNGSLGSPYAIKDYKDVNPEFGTKDDLKELIAAAHARGMEVWLDWVANHTAWDHPWVKSNIDYYSELNGERPYSPEGWNDVIELNFENPNLRIAMIDAMKYWVREFDIDGYRCDAVVFVPLSFWKEARAEVDKVKKITWLAEGDDPAYMSVFDYDYTWGFSGDLNSFGTGSNISGLVEASKKLFNNPAYKEKARMVYLTNHDLNSHGGTEFARYGANVLPLTVFYFTIYDMPLIYNGQEVGMNKELSLFDYDPVLWQPANKIYENLFKDLTRLKRTHVALEDGKNRGALEFIEVDKPNVMVYRRIRGDKEVLVVLNFNTVATKFYWNDVVPSGEYKNYLSGEKVNFSKDSGITLMEKGYQIFVK